ncbi:hypothetical protein [Micromonospora sp. NPDC001898]|uniref:hypothetical protein n=1 Tax=Micromonospora sp. NPDC001898 TaxID=3364221 RepID=UPI00367D8E8F
MQLQTLPEPDLPPARPVRPMGPTPGTGSGSRPGPDVRPIRPVFPAAVRLIPITKAETMTHPFTLADDPDFPRGVDPALLGGYVEITPDTVGLGDDPVAHALWALRRLDAGQLAEVFAYYRPAVGLRAVA